MGRAKGEDLIYNEQSGAQGTITSFSKVIVYQSGKALLTEISGNSFFPGFIMDSDYPRSIPIILYCNSADSKY